MKKIFFLSEKMRNGSNRSSEIRQQWNTEMTRIHIPFPLFRTRLSHSQSHG